MAAKNVRFSIDARDRMMRGITILADAVKVTSGPKAATWCWTRPTARITTGAMIADRPSKDALGMGSMGGMDY